MKREYGVTSREKYMRLAIESKLRGRARRLFAPLTQFSGASFPIEVTAICLAGRSKTAIEMPPSSLRRRNTDGDEIPPTGSPPNHGAVKNRAFPLPATLAAIMMALALVGCEKPAVKVTEKSLVRTAVVEPMGHGRADGEAAYLAAVKFDHETDLNFKVGGIVTVIGPAANTDWDEGTPVKAGTVLAELKQSDFQNALDTARAKAELADKTRERFRKLRATDAISQQELDVVEAEWRTAQAALDQAQHNLRDSRLVADKNGVILARYVNRGVTVPPSQRVLRFADTSLMSVELGLPDRLIGKLTPGQEIEVEISALEGMPPFKGRVSEVGVAASGEGRLFRVVIKVPNPDGLLRSGMTARIRVGDASAAASGTVCIPLSALVTHVSDGGSQLSAQTQLGVFVVQEGKAVKRTVKTGDILKSSILITEGLRAGEQVVTSGASLLYDGAPIEVAPELVTK
jgi:multidrug efflux system membrane fusion protein